MSHIGDDEPGPNAEVIDPEEGAGPEPADQVPAPKPDPEDAIQQAERELQKAQDKLADAKDQAKRDDEIDKAVAEYKAVQVDLEADEAAILEHLGNAMDDLRPTPKEVDKVDREIKQHIQDIDKLAASVGKQRADLAAKKEALKARTAERDAAKNAFDALKNQVKGVEDRHRAMNTVRKEVVDARSKGHRLLAYYLLTHGLNRAIDGKPAPVEFDDYRKVIRESSAAYGALNRTVADLQASIKEDEKKLAASEKELADLEKAYDANLRAKLTK